MMNHANKTASEPLHIFTKLSNLPEHAIFRTTNSTDIKIVCRAKNRIFNMTRGTSFTLTCVDENRDVSILSDDSTYGVPVAISVTEVITNSGVILFAVCNYSLTMDEDGKLLVNTISMIKFPNKALDYHNSRAEITATDTNYDINDVLNSVMDESIAWVRVALRQELISITDMLTIATNIKEIQDYITKKLETFKAATRYNNNNYFFMDIKSILSLISHKG